MSPDLRQILSAGAEQLGAPLNDGQLDQFARLTELLLDWNTRLNLTRITDPFEIVVKHYLDSISLLSVVKVPDGARLIDVGTGAGIPGIPLKIAVPGLKLTLLDSVRKRLNFVDAVIDDFRFANICTVHARAEDAGNDKAHRERYDFAVSRAVSRLGALTELCLPFCKVGGLFIAYKGPDVDAEIGEAKRSLRVMGGEIAEVRRFALPQSELTRTLVVVKKIRRTPLAYPRRAGMPDRDPLL